MRQQLPGVALLPVLQQFLFFTLTDASRSTSSNPCAKYYPIELDSPCSTSTCISCGKGYGVIQQCTKTTKTVCERCVAGSTYSSTDSYIDPCYPRSYCGPNQVAVREPTADRDAACRCKDGWTTESPDILDVCKKRIPVVPTKVPSSPPLTSVAVQTTSPRRHYSTHAVIRNTTRRPPSVHTPTKPSIKGADGSFYLTIVAVSVCSIALAIAVIVVLCYWYCRFRRKQRMSETSVPLVDRDGEKEYISVVSAGEKNFKVKSRLPVTPWTKVNWTKDGSSIDSQNQGGSYVLKEVSLKDAGTYCCFLPNGRVREIELIVKVDPAPVYQVQRATMIQLNFYVKSSEHMAWAYQWFKNGCRLVCNPKEYKGESAEELTILEAGKEDAYYCEARSSSGYKIYSRPSTVAGCLRKSDNDTNNFTHKSAGPTEEEEKEEEEEEERGKEVADAEIAQTVAGVQSQDSQDSQDSHPVEATSEHPIIPKVKKADELRLISDLSQKMLNALSTTIDGHRFPQSLLEIAETIEVDTRELHAVINRRSMSPGYYILTSLEGNNKFFPLAKLCTVFVDCDRPDCAIKLVELAEKSGRKFTLPVTLIKKMHLHDPQDDEIQPQDGVQDQVRVEPLPETPPLDRKMSAKPLPQPEMASLPTSIEEAL